MALKNVKRLGKSEVRQKFLPLVQAVASGSGTVEITDRGKVAAVLISYQDFQLLLARAGESYPPRGSLVGSMELVGDLEKANAEIADMFRKSIEKTAREL